MKPITPEPRKTFTRWLRETLPRERNIGVKLEFRGNVIYATRLKSQAENLQLACVLLIALLGHSPFKKNVADLSEFSEEGGKITFFRPHNSTPACRW